MLHIIVSYYSIINNGRGEKMKRLYILVIILLMLVTVSACTKKEKDTVTILTPMGSPALSQMYVEEKKDEYNYKIDAVQGADALSSAFLTKSYDIIFAPLNLGAKMYINNQNYKLLAIVTDCNYYFVVKSDTELTLDTVKSMNITLFGEAAMSGIISRYVPYGPLLPEKYAPGIFFRAGKSPQGEA